MRTKSSQKKLKYIYYQYMYFFVFISKNDIRRGTPYRPLQALTGPYCNFKISEDEDKIFTKEINTCRVLPYVFLCFYLQKRHSQGYPLQALTGPYFNFKIFWTKGIRSKIVYISILGELIYIHSKIYRKEIFIKRDIGSHL